MPDSIQPARCHSRHEALEFAGGVAAGLLPARATGDDLRATMADPTKRRQIAEALDKIMFSVPLPVAVVDVGGGRTATVTLLADAVFDPSSARPRTVDFHRADGGVTKAVVLAEDEFDPKKVATAVTESAERHLDDHRKAMSGTGHFGHFRTAAESPGDHDEMGWPNSAL